jgi:hypothetical protein
MNALDLRKKKLELARVQMSRMELEFKVDERKEEISRLEDLIKIQTQKESDLTKEIEG